MKVYGTEEYTISDYVGDSCLNQFIVGLGLFMVFVDNKKNTEYYILPFN